MKHRKVEIILMDGSKVYADKNTKGKRCECSAMIYFVKTAKGKSIPIHRALNGWVSHIGRCPDNKYNKIKKKKDEDKQSN